MKIVVAPNAFKGSLTAPQAAAAIARGVREVLPDAEIVEIPVADGGDGTVEALVSAHHGTFHAAEVEGPLGHPVTAVYGLIDGSLEGWSMSSITMSSMVFACAFGGAVLPKQL